MLVSLLMLLLWSDLQGAARVRVRVQGDEVSNGVGISSRKLLSLPLPPSGDGKEEEPAHKCYHVNLEIGGILSRFSIKFQAPSIFHRLVKGSTPPSSPSPVGNNNFNTNLTVSVSKNGV